MTNIRRALIVDDEAPAREFLRALLSAHPEVQIVGEAANVTEAIAQYHALQPDLIFLDVQMPKQDGFSLLPELRPVPEIIFVTAYDCFAVKAFEVNAVDYLVKPIREDRLALALMRLFSSGERQAKPFTQNDRIFLYSDLELRVVMPNDITHIEAEGNYSRVHFIGKESLFIRRKMSEWEALLPRDLFARVDRSLLINLQSVSKVRSLPEHQTQVHLMGAKALLELGRMASSRLKKALLAIQSV
jgi:two-component system LytT family response regulator